MLVLKTLTCHEGYSMKFTPFANDDDEVRVNRDLRVAFQAFSTCVQSTEWRLGENDTTSGRRLIITGRDDGRGSYGNYFRIVETQSAGIYNIEWCPTEVCPTCRFICGTGGILRENGRILLGLDGTPLPVEFQKKDD
ncbi:Miraculin protein [Spatholobus suberectus]|nr:Miraculin protein [Spatholobus suberectus]